MVILFANDGERGLIVDGREGGVVPCVRGHRAGGVLGAAEDANGRGAEAALRRGAAADGASVPLCTARQAMSTSTTKLCLLRLGCPTKSATFHVVQPPDQEDLQDRHSSILIQA